MHFQRKEKYVRERKGLNKVYRWHYWLQFIIIAIYYL